jgi:para-nitrobenzyl esterase
MTQSSRRHFLKTSAIGAMAADKNSPQDQEISNRMSKSWAAFARTGNPNTAGQENWPVYTLKDDVMRDFAEGKEIIKDLFKERVDYQILRLRELFALEYIKDRL